MYTCLKQLGAEYENFNFWVNDPFKCVIGIVFAGVISAVFNFMTTSMQPFFDRGMISRNPEMIAMLSVFINCKHVLQDYQKLPNVELYMYDQTLNSLV